MSLAAAHPMRHHHRSWLVIGAAATIVVCGLFWIDSPARRWLLDQRVFKQVGPVAHPPEETLASSPLPAEAAVVAFGIVDVDGGEVRLSPQVPGKIADVMVSDGDRVKAGAPLLRLRSVLAERRLMQANETVLQATLKLQIANRAPKLYVEKIKEQMQGVTAAKEAVEGLKDALADIEQQGEESIVAGRRKTMQRELNVASAKLEAERRRLEQIKLNDPAEEIEVAQADLAKAKAAVAEGEEFVDQHTLTAPESGVILRVMVSKGQVLGNLMQPAILFRPDRKTILRCEVNQEFADRLKNGCRAEVFTDKLDGKKWRGKVVRLSDWIAPRRSQLDEPFEKNDVRTMEAIVEFESDPPVVRQGQRLRVVFLTD
jgi:multidrug efflux pump subunit AcrA (membrane-fusion protein)